MFCLTLSILQSLIEWDTRIFLLLNGWHTDYWDNFMEFFTGRFVWIPFYASIGYAMIRQFHWKACVICLSAALLLLVVNDQMCSSVIRHAVGRMRPSNLDNPISAMVYVVDGYRGGRFGFPSAHATNCWGLTFFMIYVFRRLCLSVTMGLWALLMCYSRIYLGVHYFGDVLAGMLLGAVNASLAYWVLRRYYGTIIPVVRQRAATEFIVRWPVMVCCVSVVLMLVLAFFVDPCMKL